MDFGANDELDYEEDALERDSLENNSETMKCLGKELSTSKDFLSFEGGGEEDYLQINCLEEDEKFFSDEQPSKDPQEKSENFISNKQPSETFSPKIAAEETMEAHKIKKADAGEAKEQKIHVRKGLCTQINHSNDISSNNGIAIKKKIKMGKRAQLLKWRGATKKKSSRPLSVNPWLREVDSSEGSGKMKSSGVPCKHRFLPPHRKCPTSKKPKFSFATSDVFQQAQVPQQEKLAAENKKFVSSSSSFGAINVRKLTKQRFKPLMNQSLRPFDEDIRQFKNDNQTMSLPKKLACNNKMDCDVSSNSENLSNAGFTQENAKTDILRRNRGDFIQSYRIGEPKENRGCITFKGSDVRNTCCFPLNKAGWEYEGNNDERKKCFTAVNALKDDEKELVKLKKEARRKRFMQDATINEKEKKSFEPNVVTKSCNCLPSDFIEVGEPKLLEEKFRRREDQDCKSAQDFLLQKTNFKKELLLKKRNPFGGRVEIKKCITGTKVKKEVFWNETFERAESSVLKDAKVEKELTENKGSKVLEGLRFNGPSLFAVKNETGSQVKFVRTISKSLDELGFGKSKTEVFPERNDDTAFALEALPFASESLQEQVTSQLTGRIVKVLNIPPSATTNDILSLCGDIGIVREVKLNFPKENSAVIRFAEPSSAENFFSLYHGQKMNNYFLNVIII